MKKLLIISILFLPLVGMEREISDTNTQPPCKQRRVQGTLECPYPEIQTGTVHAFEPPKLFAEILFADLNELRKTDPELTREILSFLFQVKAGNQEPINWPTLKKAFDERML